VSGVRTNKSAFGGDQNHDNFFLFATAVPITAKNKTWQFPAHVCTLHDAV